MCGERGRRVWGGFSPLSLCAREGGGGVLALPLPYRPIAAGIAADTRRLYLLTLGGLLLLYLLLFRIVYGASKRIERQQDSLNARAEENERLALTDQLTGLPNRILFTRLLAERIDAAKAGAGAVSVVPMDLDRFKDVNDTLGDDVSDQLLVEGGAPLAPVARRAEQP